MSSFMSNIYLILLNTLLLTPGICVSVNVYGLSKEYARDSWRMSEQEKSEIVDIITLERRTRMRENCRIEVCSVFILNSNIELQGLMSIRT